MATREKVSAQAGRARSTTRNGSRKRRHEEDYDDAPATASRRPPSRRTPGRTGLPGRVDFDPPPRLFRGPTGTGKPRHRDRSPGKSNIVDPAGEQLQQDLERGRVGSTEGEEEDDSDEPGESDGNDLPLKKGDKGKGRQWPPPRSTAQGPPASGKASRATTKPVANPPYPTRKVSSSKSSVGQHANDHGEDERLCISMQNLVRQVAVVAEILSEYPDDRSGILDALLDDTDNAQVVRYIGCLAMGGSKGKRGWEELLADEACRKALFVGIIGRALKEHVFGSLWFGASPAQLKKLQEMEQGQGMAHKDGFYRTKERAKKIESLGGVADDVDFAINKLTVQLGYLLAPLSGLGVEQRSLGARMLSEIRKVVAQAAEISQSIRATKDVVYYWPPTFKDEEFEPSRMECLNLDDMISNSPYDKKKVQGSFERAILRAGQENRSEAIVRVVCFPGLVAYRQHGGELGRKEVEAELEQRSFHPQDVQASYARSGDKLDPNNGFRSKVICKSLVHLQWGKQRLLTREAGTSAHLDAMKAGNMKKYEDDTKHHVELYDEFEQRHGLRRAK